jgi:ATP-dependent Lon protease
METKMSEQFQEKLTDLPILPLRDVVVYPHMVIPLFVGREKSILALDKAMEIGRASCRERV